MNFNKKKRCKIEPEESLQDTKLCIINILKQEQIA